MTGWAKIGCVLLWGSVPAFLSGCFLLDASRDLETLRDAALLRGEVRGASQEGKPIVIALLEGDAGARTLRSYYLRYGEGPFEFTAAAGTATLFAVEDANENVVFDPGEPAAWYGGREPKPIEVTAGARLDDLRIDLTAIEPVGAAEIRALAAKGRGETPDLTAVNAGDVASLDDSRFDDQVGQWGLWEPAKFLQSYGAGIYFLEPYDPARIPVLFVHGAGGTPRSFAALAASLDHTRYQAWVFHYPSGLRLSGASDLLRRALDELYLRHRFAHLDIVAHSMGGLISRDCINAIARRQRPQYVQSFVTIATPWRGHKAARMGTRYSPVVVPSWLDMVPGSTFLTALFAEPLPPTIPYHLFFGYEGGDGTDGTVSLESMLAPPAQNAAVEIFGFAEDHVSILDNPTLLRKVNRALRTGAGPFPPRLASAPR